MDEEVGKKVKKAHREDDLKPKMKQSALSKKKKKETHTLMSYSNILVELHHRGLLLTKPISSWRVPFCIDCEMENYCLYHGMYGHDIDECIRLKKDVQQLLHKKIIIKDQLFQIESRTSFMFCNWFLLDKYLVIYSV